MNDLVTVVFRIINFMILIGVGIFLFRRYVLPGLRADYNKDTAFKHNLEQQKRTLEEQAYELDARTAKQVIKGDYLAQRTIAWEHSIAEKKNARATEKKEREVQLAQVYRKQYQEIEAHALKKQVVPQALQQAHKKLVDEYSDSSHGKQALSLLIKHIQEKAL